MSDLADAQKVHVGRLVGQQQGQGVPDAAHTGSSANPVHKHVRILRWIKLDNPGYVRNIQAPRCYVRAEQHTYMQ